jgi:hypothetical protein
MAAARPASSAVLPVCRPISLIAFCLVAPFAVADDKPKLAAKDPVGLGLSTMKAGSLDLRLAFQLDKKDNRLTAKMFSIDQTDPPVMVEAVSSRPSTRPC